MAAPNAHWAAGMNDGSASGGQGFALTATKGRGPLETLNFSVFKSSQVQDRLGPGRRRQKSLIPARHAQGEGLARAASKASKFVRA